MSANTEMNLKLPIYMDNHATTRTDPRALKWPKGVYEYSCTPEEWIKAWRVKDWNTARIRCVGKYPQITTWVPHFFGMH